MMPTLERQARVLRTSTRRPVKLEGAYLERVVVNLMGGQGETEVFLDDLEVGPFKAGTVATDSAANMVKLPARPAGNARNGEEIPFVRLVGNVIQRLGPDRRYHGWLPTVIDAPGADPIKLRSHGYDILATDAKPDKTMLDAAVKAA